MPAKTINLSELRIKTPRKYYSRSLNAKQIKLIRALEIELMGFKSLYADSGYGSPVYKRHFFDILDSTSKAFGAYSLSSLSEFTGVSARQISKIRKGEFPQPSIVGKIVDTVLDACGFYLQKGGSEDLPPGWVAVPVEARECISEVGDLLNRVLLTARGGKNKSDLILTPIERAELIAILETALALLKCPLVEKGFLEKLKGALIRISKKAAEKELELGLSAAASGAGVALGHLLAKYLT